MTLSLEKAGGAGGRWRCCSECIWCLNVQIVHIGAYVLLLASVSYRGWCVCYSMFAFLIVMLSQENAGTRCMFESLVLTNIVQLLCNQPTESLGLTDISDADIHCAFVM